MWNPFRRKIAPEEPAPKYLPTGNYLVVRTDVVVGDFGTGDFRHKIVAANGEPFYLFTPIIGARVQKITGRKKETVS